MKIAGIYIDKGYNVSSASEYGLHLGKNQFAWFANGTDIYDLHDCVELGGGHNLIELSQCTFGINKIAKEWHIKDNSLPKDSCIIAKGKYRDDYVEKQVSKFIKDMIGI